MSFYTLYSRGFLSIPLIFCLSPLSNSSVPIIFFNTIRLIQYKAYPPHTPTDYIHLHLSRLVYTMLLNHNLILGSLLFVWDLRTSRDVISGLHYYWNPAWYMHVVLYFGKPFHELLYRGASLEGILRLDFLQGSS